MNLQHSLLAVYICVITLLCGCVHQKRESQLSASDSKVSTIMLEIDRHGERFTNVLNRTPLVDAHSALVVEFPKQTSGTNTSIPPEWQELQSVIRVLNEHAMEWQRLGVAHRAVVRSDTNSVEKMRQQLRALDDKANDLRKDLGTLGITGARLRGILLGTAPGIAHPSENGYLNLAQWATNNWEELKASARAYEEHVSAERRVMVTVQAFRESLFRDSAVLHVDNWDKFPEGVYSPIDRTGLRPTEAEQQRLEAARKAADSVVSLVNSAKTNELKLKQTLKAAMLEVKAMLDGLVSDMDNLAANWEGEVPKRINQKLEELAGSNEPEIQRAAIRLRDTSGLLQKDVSDLLSVIKNLMDLPKKIAPAGNVDPTSLMFGGSGVLKDIQSAAKQLETLPKRLTAWPNQLQAIAADMKSLAPSFDQGMNDWLRKQFVPMLDEFREAFPNETEQVLQLLAMLSPNALGAAGAMQVLGDADPAGNLIGRSSDQLVNARLDLKRSGLALGDVVSLRIRGTNSVGELVVNETYYHEVGFVGLHGKPAVHFIFARGLSGSDEATQWKPNVAAAVEWHYTIREPRSAFEQTWNWLYPGAGIHLASLDQTDENFEIGAGGNISFWDGLLTGGFGFNFSADRPYVWVGVNLLSALSQAKQAFHGGQP